MAFDTTAAEKNLALFMFLLTTITGSESLNFRFPPIVLILDRIYYFSKSKTGL